MTAKGSRVALALCAAAGLLGCSGSAGPVPDSSPAGGGDVVSEVPAENEGPTEYASPDDFSFSSMEFPPKCGPPVSLEQRGPSLSGSRTMAFELPNQVSLLVRGGARGLELLDVSDPAHPQLRSRGAVRGSILPLARASSTELWVAAFEPAALSVSPLSTAAELLSPQTRLVRLDVSDPATPVRLAETLVSGDFSHFEQRGAELWVLTSRRGPTDQICAVLDSPCGYAAVSHEALELRGYRPSGSGLESIASAEVPLGRRVWWMTDGVATVTDDGVLHVLAWDAAGTLRAPFELLLPGEQPWNGPFEVRGNELSLVGYAGRRATLYRYDLASGSSAPQRSFDLGPLSVPPDPLSLFLADKLWLNPQWQAAGAALWDLGVDPPEPIPLPRSYTRLLPVSGVSLDGQPTATATLAWLPVVSETDIFEVLAIDAREARIVGPAGSPSADVYAGLAVPPSVRVSGVAPTWSIEVRGAGLPLGVAPDAPRVADGTSQVLALVGIPSGPSPDDPVRAEAVLTEADTGSQPNAQLEIRVAGRSARFDVPRTSSSLLAVTNGVLVLGTTLRAVTAQGELKLEF